MDYKKFNISRPRPEVLKDGTEKTFWDNVGVATIFIKEDGSESGIVELRLLDKTVKLNLFPFKPKVNVAETNNYSQPAPVDDGSQVPPTSTAGNQAPPAGEEIKVENIPF